MPQSATYPGDVSIGGSLFVGGGVVGVTRNSLSVSSGMVYPIPIVDFRVHDAFQTLLGTPASDDLGIGTGTFATGFPYISTGDLKNAGATTRYGRVIFKLPPEYVAGSALSVIFDTGMITTVASASADLDCEAYLLGSSSLVSGSDLVTTSLQSINSLTFANKEFALTSTNLVAGSTIDLRVSIAITDSATATAVIGAIAAATFSTSIRG